MAVRQHNDWWRFTATGAMGFIAAMFIGWFSGLNEAVTRADVQKMIESEGPYIMDRQSLQKGLESIEVLRDKVDQIATTQAAMAAKMGIQVQGEKDGK